MNNQLKDQRENTGSSPKISEATMAGGAQNPQSTGGAAGVTSTLKETARQTKEQLKQTASSAADQIKAQGSEAINDIRHRGEDFLSQQKGQILDQLQHCSMATRRAAEQLRQDNAANLAGYVDTMAGQLERAGSYLRDRDFRGVYNDVEGFARRQPELFFGGMFVVGLALARFFKASRQSQERIEMDVAYTSELDWYPEDEAFDEGMQPAATAGMPSSGINPVLPQSATTPGANPPLPSTGISGQTYP